MPTEIIKSGEVRVRIAPSPTGPLHIGTARTALFNFLFAKKHRGTFILRIEDTDLERSDPKYEKDIVEHLKWLGIAWDEGVEVGGEYAPYRQSERIYTYSKYVQKLLGEGKAFYCFHSKEELGRERQDQLKAKQTPIHLCEHRGLPERKIKYFMAKGNYVIRFVAPKKKVIFQDLIHGEVEFDTSLFGDFSIAKEIGVPLYNFAAAVDDFEMKISHVIRGEDHISNTPKQILIQEALDFPRPKYAHLPLILNPDRSKLSKRYLETSIGDYRVAGYLPEALVNFMVFLGWSPGTDREIFSLDELVEEFGLEKVQKSGAVFNVEKLDWFNGHYVRQKKLDELAKLCLPYLSAQASPGEIDLDYAKKIVALERDRMKKLSDIRELAGFFLKEKLEYEKELLRWKKMTDEEVATNLKTVKTMIEPISDDLFTAAAIKETLDKEAEKTGKGELYWPFRAALSGLKQSPPPQEIAEVLGKEKTLLRIRAAIEKIGRG